MPDSEVVAESGTDFIIDYARVLLPSLCFKWSQDERGLFLVCSKEGVKKMLWLIIFVFWTTCLVPRLRAEGTQANFSPSVMELHFNKYEYVNWFGPGTSTVSSTPSCHLFSDLDAKRIQFCGLCLGFNKDASGTELYLPPSSKCLWWSTVRFMLFH
jgi:hypothetical protein